MFFETPQGDVSTVKRTTLFLHVALGIGAASFASVSGTSFGDGDEVTELVEVPKFCVRDENLASKDIAESPTRSGTPKRMYN